MFDEKDSKYLNIKDPTTGRTADNTGNMISYASFPRSGNSFLRQYLHKITGIATGSDMKVEFNAEMQMKDFKGEEITDSSIWVYKSHHPMKMGPPGAPNNNFRARCNKIISCVRNPYDVLASMPHMGGTHNQA